MSAVLATIVEVGLLSATMARFLFHADLGIWHRLLRNNSSVGLVCERTIRTERPPLADEVSANVCG
jgi:hypothetical protein